MLFSIFFFFFMCVHVHVCDLQGEDLSPHTQHKLDTKKALWGYFVWEPITYKSSSNSSPKEEEVQKKSWGSQISTSEK